MYVIHQRNGGAVGHLSCIVYGPFNEHTFHVTKGRLVKERDLRRRSRHFGRGSRERRPFVTLRDREMTKERGPLFPRTDVVSPSV